jgi:hypothetical protein
MWLYIAAQHHILRRHIFLLSHEMIARHLHGCGEPFTPLRAGSGPFDKLRTRIRPAE